jgi:ribose 5-phosphate isomerase B
MIALGSDHAGFELKHSIIKHLEERKLEYKDFGCFSEESADYAEYAELVARAIVDGKFEQGILCCGTGVGISIAANKIRGIRAACCSDRFSAEATRLHNDANILCLGGRVVSPAKANELVDLFLDTKFSGEERHVRRIKQITELENKEYAKANENKDEKAESEKADDIKEEATEEIKDEQ